MFYRSPAAAAQRRPGVVLLVVMAMLALFASLALSFVFYADAEATSAGYSRDAQFKNDPYIDPDMLASYFLSQMIYDTTNPYSAMRGWSLSRSIYGNNPGVLNYTPYNGIGRSALSYTVPFPSGAVDNFKLTNYQQYSAPQWSGTTTYAAGNLVIDTASGNSYLCILANVGQPVTNATYWQVQPLDVLLNNLRMPEGYGNAATIAQSGGAVLAAGVITFTTTANHGFTAGQPVVITGVPVTGYNGLYTIATAGGNTFTVATGAAGLPPSGGGAAFRYVGGANPPWTSYDTNSLFLAQVGVDGSVYLPSFMRPWNGVAVAGSPATRYASMSPDPAWNSVPSNPFVLPDAVNDPLGLHVKNLDVGPGMNDSIWMDLGYPILTAPNGKRYKPLFAPLIMDMSNRINLWAHGNRLGDKGASVSNQGWGSTEVNPTRLANLNPAEWQTLINYRYAGRAGLTMPVTPPFSTAPPALVPGQTLGFPTTVPLTTPARVPPWYSLIDADGLGADASGNPSGTYPFFVATITWKSTGAVGPGAGTMNLDGLLTGKTPTGFPWTITPGSTLVVDTGASAESVSVTTVNLAAQSFTATFTKAHAANAQVGIGSGFFGFPTYPGKGWENTTSTELTNPPLAYNVQTPGLRPIPYHMEAPLRWGGTGAPALTSDLFSILPKSLLADPSLRNKITTASWTFDRVHASPVISFDQKNPPIGSGYMLVPGQVPPNLYPKLMAPRVQAPTTTATVAPFYAAPAPDFTGGAPLPPNNDFIVGDWRSTLGSKLRVNLNRPLTNYPYPPTLPGSTVIDPATYSTYNTAVADRVRLAQDIYNALVSVTGAKDPNVLPPAVLLTIDPATDGSYVAARWLAQLAVNIVDYIDSDDYITPWNWNANAFANASAAGTPIFKNEFVFGTELPRLVLNEVHGQLDNLGTDDGIYTSTTSQANLQPTPKAKTYRMNLWAELQNPLSSVPVPGSIYPFDNSTAYLQNGTNPVYVVVVTPWNNGIPGAGPSAFLRDPSNNPGDLDPASAANPLTMTISNWGAGTTSVLPANGAPQSGATTKAITTIAQNAAGTTITVTSALHGFAVGQVVVLAGVTDPRYNGTYTITATAANTFDVTCLPTTTPSLPASMNGTATVGLDTASGKNTGFFVLGPSTTFLNGAAAARDPLLPTTFQSPNMSIPINNLADPLITTPGTVNVTVLLRRLLCPHLPPNPPIGGALNQALPYNPYVTVDYLDGIPIVDVGNAATVRNDGRVYDGNGVKAVPPAGWNTFFSFGRSQAYAASTKTTPSQVLGQTAVFPPGQPNNTFFSQNTNVRPFDWLVHLDRPPVNALELRYVSAFKPHELTQQFVAMAGTPAAARPHQHFAPWTPGVRDPNSILYRAFEMFSCANHMQGTKTGGRIPGPVNLNTIMSPDIFQAICDSQDLQPKNLFTGSGTVGPPVNDVDAIFANLVASRGAPINARSTSEGAPFSSFAAGDFSNTLLRPYPAIGSPPLFQAPSQAADPNFASYHPYVKGTLLRKIHNNVTTTSNVFAVWWTVGYFEVTDETVKPAKLGAEIGRAQNRHVRHRFFALVDRSSLRLFSTSSNSAVAAGLNQTVTLNTAITPATANGIPVTLQQGMLLDIIDNPSSLVSETVVVKTVPSAISFTADFANPHTNYRIVCRGNPGPKNGYNPHADQGVVLHMSIIK